MKNLFLFIALLFLCTAIGQNKPVAEKVQQAHKSNQDFESFHLFDLNAPKTNSNVYSKAAKNVSVLTINNQELNKLIKNKPQNILLSIPFNGEEIKLELIKKKILTEDFIAKDENGNVIDYQPGAYYHGVIKGDNKSLVAVSFFENDIVGTVSSDHLGNLVLGKSKNKQDFLAYSDKDILSENPFSCGVDELPENSEQISFDPQMLSKAPMTENCVRIYYEIANAPYQNNGSDETETLNWITAIHNNINTLYDNDDIKIALSEVMIWTNDDPYDGNYNQNLYEFRETRTTFNGDLAHLINYPATTSVAFLNSLCGEYRYAYSGIDMFYEEVPTYSWTIMAMTHEMGHGLGSPHTHACAWNGDNTAIDGCGPMAGYGEGCDAPLPDDGGTIMSYCHLIFGEINLANGFGPQPGALIRNTVESKPCLSSDCISSCAPTISDISVQEISENQYRITVTDNISNQWGYRIYEYGTTPGAWIVTDSPIIETGNLSSNAYYQVEVGNSCGGELFSGIKIASILSGNWCGNVFTDTGGDSGNYDDYQYIVKTFYPAAAGDNVQLTFTEFDLEADYDFMFVYNGNSINAPLFANGNNLSGSNIPTPFLSTAEDGSITVQFISDGGVTNQGWSAMVGCAPLSVEDMDGNSVINVYPNPASSVLNIDAQKEIISVKLNDASGKTVLKKKSNSLNDKINIQHLPKGVYVLTVEMKEKTVTKKIIKN